MLLLPLLLGMEPGRPHLSQGRYRLAAASARRALEQTDEASHHATLGNALARMSRCDEAIQHHEAAAGDPFYERYGVVLHADCLRTLGFPGQAIALREGQEVSSRRQTSLAQDHLAQGDLNAAHAALDLGLAWSPYSADLEGMRARLYLAEGDLEAAEASAWLAQTMGPSLHTAIARIDLEDDPMGKLERAHAAREYWPWNPELYARHVQAWRALGFEDLGCNMANMRGQSFSDHPALLDAATGCPTSGDTPPPSP